MKTPIHLYASHWRVYHPDMDIFVSGVIEFSTHHYTEIEYGLGAHGEQVEHRTERTATGLATFQPLALWIGSEHAPIVPGSAEWEHWAVQAEVGLMFSECQHVSDYVCRHCYAPLNAARVQVLDGVHICVACSERDTKKKTALFVIDEDDNVHVVPGEKVAYEHERKKIPHR